MFGFVSLPMDILLEIIHSLLPVFVVTALGASAFCAGFIEDVAETTALIAKVFPDALSNYLGRRKGIVVLGYALGAPSKPFFALVPGVGAVLAACLANWIGEGIRGAPHDASITDIASSHLRGAAFELRQSSDTVGVFLDPLIAIGLVFLWANDFRAIFWVAVIPDTLSVLLSLVGVREPDTHVGAKQTSPIKWANLVRFGHPYQQVITIRALFTLARFSEAFLVLRSQQVSLPLYLAPLVLVAMNVVYSPLTYPFGKLSGRLRHTTLLAWSLGALILASLVLAVGAHWAATLAGVAVWGPHMDMTQGLPATMVVNTTPEGLHGTVFDFFNLAGGLVLSVASALAGLLWNQLGATSISYTGVAFRVATIALVILTWYGARKLPSGETAGAGCMCR